MFQIFIATIINDGNYRIVTITTFIENTDRPNIEAWHDERKSLNMKDTLIEHGWFPLGPWDQSEETGRIARVPVVRDFEVQAEHGTRQWGVYQVPMLRYVTPWQEVIK